MSVRINRHLSCVGADMRQSRISERTSVLFDYKAAFQTSVEQVRKEGRYRVFADLKRVRGQFPLALRRREDGSE